MRVGSSVGAASDRGKILVMLEKSALRGSTSKARAVTLAAGLSALLACAAPSLARAETLLEALAAAYKFNPRLDAGRALQRATDEEVPRALSGYRPQVSGSADTSYQKQITEAAACQQQHRGQSRAGTRWARCSRCSAASAPSSAVNAAEATVRAGWETLRITEAAVLLEAVTAYGDVVRDTAIVKLRENNVTVLTRDLRATQDRFNVGEVTRTDVAQAQARRAAAVAALDLARANLKTSRATFERVIGHPPSNVVEAKRQQAGAEVRAAKASRSPPARAPTWWRRSTASRRPGSPST